MAEPLKVTVRPDPALTPNVPSGGWEVVETTPIVPTQGSPSGEAWAPVSTQPVGAAPVAPNEWAPVSTAPAPVEPTGGLTDPKTGVFPFNYPATFSEMNAESRERMAKGVETIREAPAIKNFDDLLEAIGAVGMGSAETAAGAIGYVTDPVTAVTRSVAGQPVENATGLPKAYTEFLINLGIPGIGMAKLPKGKELLRPAQEVLAPETVARSFPGIAGGEDAAGLIRQNTGLAARATEQTAHQLESYYPVVNRMTPAEQVNIQNYIDGGVTATAPATPELRSFADAMKGALQERKAELQALSPQQQQQFLDEYFPHFWQTPNGQPAQAAQWAGMGKQGSGLSLKARSIPTIEEGIAAGLTPVYTNPIDATMRYVMSMDKFIAATKVFKQAERDGTVVWIKPQSMGASGNPMGGGSNLPSGYVPLTGRGSVDGPFQAYAPEAFARVYNNWLSQGYEQFGPNAAKGYNGIRLFTNSMTQSLLGLSGYHALTMAEAGISTTLAQGIAAMRGGDWSGILKAFKAPGTPVAMARRGKELKEIYLGLARNVSPEDKEIVDLITQAGGRMGKSTTHATDLQTSALGDYFTAWRRAELSQSFRKQFGAGGVPGTAKGIVSTLGRTLETVNKPLFQHYIPAMKNGAAGDLVSDWLKANPAATQAQKLAATRRIVDMVDDRFGEMIQDNIFWHKALKQSAQVAMLSYSWNVGGFRAIGAGLRDMAQFAAGQKAWTPKADYAVSTALTWVALNSLYQYAKTGETPFQTDTPVLDMIAGRTGGFDVRSGQPERILVPGIMKDVFAYATHPLQEVGNKLNPGVKMGSQLIQNKDWRDDPILSPRSPDQTYTEKLPEWLGNLVTFVANALPIGPRAAIKGSEQGSNISAFEKLLGLRPAQRQFIDPEGVEAGQYGRAYRDWYGKRGRGGKVGHDAAEKSRYGGTD